MSRQRIFNLLLSRAFSSVTEAHYSGLVGSMTTPVTKKLWQERIARQGLSALQGSKPSDALAKHPEVHSIVYPISSDVELRESYRSPWDYIRVGKLLEDCDSMAGNVAFCHTDDGSPDTRPPLLVTANVERIALRRHMPIDGGDLELTGRVIWTGNSSMDILVQVFQQSPAPSLSAIFTFVARDPLQPSKALKINPLLPDSNEDTRLFEERQSINDMRKALRAGNPELGSILGSLASSSGVGGASPSPKVIKDWTEEVVREAKAHTELPALASPSSLLMSQTKASNIFVTQPQHKNLHGRVFGGFLLRRAYELAFANAYSFAGVRPQFVSMDDISFSKPVEIGSLLKLNSMVVHAGESQVHVEVTASITKPETVSSILSNKFSFSFAVPQGHPLKRVLPATHEEAKRAARYNLDKILGLSAAASA